MKKKAYLSYFGELLLIVLLLLYFIKKGNCSYDKYNITLLIVLYGSMIVNIYYTIKAKKRSEVLWSEIVSFSMIWVILLLALTSIKQTSGDVIPTNNNSVTTVLILSALVAPISILILIIKGIVNSKEKE